MIFYYNYFDYETFQNYLNGIPDYSKCFWIESKVDWRSAKLFMKTAYRFLTDQQTISLEHSRVYILKYLPYTVE